MHAVAQKCEKTTFLFVINCALLVSVIKLQRWAANLNLFVKLN